jgi:hypothetical protein
MIGSHMRVASERSARLALWILQIYVKLLEEFRIAMVGGRERGAWRLLSNISLLSSLFHLCICFVWCQESLLSVDLIVTRSTRFIAAVIPGLRYLELNTHQVSEENQDAAFKFHSSNCYYGLSTLILSERAEYAGNVILLHIRQYQKNEP